MRIFERLREFEGLWSLAALIKEHWIVLTSFTVALIGPLTYFWRYVDLTAANVGWWVYPFVVSLAMLSLVGVLMLVLMFSGKIGFGSKQDWYKRREIAKKAQVLADELAGLLAEYSSERNAAWWRSSSQDRKNSGNRDIFSQSDYSRLQARITARYVRDFYSRTLEVVTEARLFVYVDDSGMWRIQHSAGSVDLLSDVIFALKAIAVQLNDERPRKKLPEEAKNTGAKSVQS